MNELAAWPKSTMLDIEADALEDYFKVFKWLDENKYLEKEEVVDLHRYSAAHELGTSCLGGLGAAFNEELGLKALSYGCPGQHWPHYIKPANTGFQKRPTFPSKKEPILTLSLDGQTT